MDKQANLVRRVQNIFLKWILTIVLGVIAFGVGISLGYQNYLHAPKTLSFDSAHSPNNTEPPTSPTAPH